MTLHLIRHAAAGDRSRWDGDDLERPLSERGRQQAAAIAAHLEDAPVRAIFSSIATRCVQTVEPMAEARRLEVQTMRVLTEGGRPVDLVELLRTEAALDGDLVLCSHGDLIPEVLNRFLRDGMSIVGPRGCEKGSIWSLETKGRDIVRGTYLASP